jgi:glycosyltransferase involved in cell wall biosynthesis
VPEVSASIVIPTRARPEYLDVALRSVMPQATAAGAEVIVVSDGHDPATAAVAARAGAKLLVLERSDGINSGRNAGARAAKGELLIFVDDDVKASPGWLAALLAGAAAHPSHDAFGGPIRPVLEGGGPRACGRESAPITNLDLGVVDTDVELVWGANLGIRRRAFESFGPFDETIAGCGDEEDWLRRYAAAGGRIRYLAAAGLDHRRTEADATVRALSRAAYHRGRAARRYDLHRGAAPPIAKELRTLAGCAWHTARRRCAIGIVLGAQSWGRLREALSPQ